MSLNPHTQLLTEAGIPDAIMNGIICTRENPEFYGKSNIAVPDQYKSKLEYNQWVRVASVGPNCREPRIKPGVRVYVGHHMGTRFWLGQKEYLLIWDTDPLAIDDGESN